MPGPEFFRFILVICINVIAIHKAISHIDRLITRLGDHEILVMRYYETLVTK